MHFELCQAVVRVLVEETTGFSVSERGQVLLAELRDEFDWLEPGKTFLIRIGKGDVRWWSFAGGHFNGRFASCLDRGGLDVISDNFSVSQKNKQPDPEHIDNLKACIDQCIGVNLDVVDEDQDELKFSEAIPASIATKMSVERGAVSDIAGIVGRYGISMIIDNRSDPQ